ncbi:hypothetical protein GCM10025874_20640 [Arenivirga flava]|uniref:DUF3375 domain-containing protein n=1 Tax=Arenivirga flava TaxID=1930060 RepID=A0AA37UK88_9MICO|nr:hypothetical protein GCM10025874_20640 [Arenivirga flava]
MILSFLGLHLLETNRGAVAQSELVDLLDDHLYAIRRSMPERYPRQPVDYLEAWSSADDGWLRRFYPAGSDDVHYEATSTLEKAWRWIGELRERGFVGTESRLHTLVALLREIVHGSDRDPQVRIAELVRRRDEIDVEIGRIERGESDALDDFGVRDRFQQFSTMSRELIGDFREVEDNFRRLDRSAREQIAGWAGGKGELLTLLVDERADISSSEQGRSFQSFYDYLLSERRQDELSALLAAVHNMPTVDADHRVRVLHHDWAEAAERTQATVRTLSEQLRRFLDDRVWLENRRVLDIARSIEVSALRVRDMAPETVGLVLDEPGVPIAMPFERPLYAVRAETAVDALIRPESRDVADAEVLFRQRYIDTARLAENIRTVVPRHSIVSMADVIALYPPRDGAAEILAYLALDGEDDIDIVIDDSASMAIDYPDVGGDSSIIRRMTLPAVSVHRH